MKKSKLVFLIGGAEQGMEEYAEKNFPDFCLVPDYHQMVRIQLEHGKDPYTELDSMFELVSGRNTIIISEEQGMGVVPMDRTDRKYREINGRINCRIAERADEVYRIICGLGQRIK